MRKHEDCPTCKCEFEEETGRLEWAYCGCGDWKVQVKEILNAIPGRYITSTCCPDCFEDKYITNHKRYELSQIDGVNRGALQKIEDTPAWLLGMLEEKRKLRWIKVIGLIKGAICQE